MIDKGRAIFGVERVEIGGARPHNVTKVGIVPGGGDDTDLFAEAESLGAEAYVTGEWYTRTTPADHAGRRWAEANRGKCRVYAEQTGMALLGFSHAASEFLVMTRHMAAFFEAKGVPVHCLKQSDWWR